MIRRSRRAKGSSRPRQLGRSMFPDRFGNRFADPNDHRVRLRRAPLPVWQSSPQRPPASGPAGRPSFMRIALRNLRRRQSPRSSAKEEKLKGRFILLAHSSSAKPVSTLFHHSSPCSSRIRRQKRLAGYWLFRPDLAVCRRRSLKYCLRRRIPPASQALSRG